MHCGAAFTTSGDNPAAFAAASPSIIVANAGAPFWCFEVDQ
jgi:hypothetical protein